MPPNRTRRPHATAIIINATILICGCNGKPDIEPRQIQHTEAAPADANTRAEHVRRDPIAYLHQVAQNCAGLDNYTLTFTRHERRGLLQTMHGPEHIACRFRREPFGVHMKWLDEDIKYGESVFVKGQANDKIRFVTRWWSPPLLPPPGINKVDVSTPVFWGEAKRPVTDFGLGRLMERTLASLKEAGDQVTVSYEGLLLLRQDGPTVHHIRLDYSVPYKTVPIQDLYIDSATDLPAGTVLKYRSGRLDAAYYYADINPDVTLTDADFMLAAERQADDQ